MPSNTVRMFNPADGDFIMGSNSYRVYLRLNSGLGSQMLMLVGDSIATGIPVITKFNDDPVLLSNVVGTAIQGPVSIIKVGGQAFNITEVYRTPGGFT